MRQGFCPVKAKVSARNRRSPFGKKDRLIVHRTVQDVKILNRLVLDALEDWIAAMDAATPNSRQSATEGKA